MTIARPMFPPRRSPARAVPIYSLTPNQLEALVDLSRLRKEIEAEVERMIAFLDFVDGYSLSECEPSLGFPESNIAPVADGWGWAGVTRTDEGDQSDQRGFGCTDDREDGLPVPIELVDQFGDRFEHELEGDEHDGCEPDAWDEPSLGSVTTDASESQEHWCKGVPSSAWDVDGEIEHEDEPSLGGVGSHEFQPQFDARWRDFELEADGPELVLA